MTSLRTCGASRQLADGEACQRVWLRNRTFKPRTSQLVKCKVSSPAVHSSLDNEQRQDIPSAVGPSIQPADGKRWAKLRANKMHAQPVVERQRPLASYMALPASQYSVLDGRKIERLTDDMFRCYVGKLNFGSFSVEPVLTVSVTVEEQGCTIRLLSCKLEGSQFVNDINNKFSASMANIVRWREGASAQQKDITSDTTIEVNLQVPGWCSFIPVSTIEKTGSSVMQATLNAMVPRFLQQLQKDYDMWASGDDRRQPLPNDGL